MRNNRWDVSGKPPKGNAALDRLQQAAMADLAKRLEREGCSFPGPVEGAGGRRVRRFRRGGGVTMSHWEELGKSSDWRTPRHVFDALGVVFDIDVAAPTDGPMYVPALLRISERSLETPWSGFVWMNPPFGGRNAIVPWLDKFFGHGNGIALTPDRTSCPWWQNAAARADALLFVAGKIRFVRPDGTTGNWPSTGTTLFAAGDLGTLALHRAADAGLGTLLLGRNQFCAIQPAIRALNGASRSVIGIE